jgi:hypothetical protein
MFNVDGSNKIETIHMVVFLLSIILFTCNKDYNCVLIKQQVIQINTKEHDV